MGGLLDNNKSKSLLKDVKGKLTLLPVEQGIWTWARHTTVGSKQGVLDNHDAAVYIRTRTATDGKPI